MTFAWHFGKCMFSTWQVLVKTETKNLESASRKQRLTYCCLSESCRLHKCGLTARIQARVLFSDGTAMVFTLQQQIGDTPHPQRPLGQSETDMSPLQPRSQFCKMLHLTIRAVKIWFYNQVCDLKYRITFKYILYCTIHPILKEHEIGRVAGSRNISNTVNFSLFELLFYFIATKWSLYGCTNWQRYISDTQ